MFTAQQHLTSQKHGTIPHLKGFSFLMAIGLNTVCVKAHSFSLVLSNLQRNTRFFWGRFSFMLSTDEARNMINFNDFCWPDACTVQCRTVSAIPGELGCPLMTGTVVRPCCAKLPAQVLLSVFVCTCCCSNCPCSQR